MKTGQPYKSPLAMLGEVNIVFLLVLYDEINLNIVLIV